MNRHKHTPGPWAVERPHGEGGIYVSRTNTALIAKICYEQEANARLIAAAPELLDALRLVLAHDGALTGADWTAIRAAIAKAEGGAARAQRDERQCRSSRLASN